MPRYWTPTYIQSYIFVIPRQYWYEVALTWWPSVIVQAGNPFIIRETIYGGYRIYLKLRDICWAWSSNNYTLDWCIEDIYGMAPSNDTPIYSAAWTVGFGIGQRHKRGLLYLAFSGNLDNTLYNVLPVQPAGFWLPPPYI